MIFFLSLYGVESINCREDITKERLLGHIRYEYDPRFVRISSSYTSFSKRKLYLRKEAYQSFQKMYSSAKKQGIQLHILSGARNFDSQKRIWERKWYGNTLVQGLKLNQAYPRPMKRALIILRYSAMPGLSRHHWGTEIDLNSLENSYWKKGKGLKEYRWLTKNADRFGFCRPYNQKGRDAQNSRITGYEEERWHWSFRPLSQKMTKSFLKHIHYSDLTGFAGSSIAKKLRVIPHYAGSIASSCL